MKTTILLLLFIILLQFMVISPQPKSSTTWFSLSLQIFFFCFRSLILDCYCEKTFCVGHSWEMKRYLRSKSSPNSGLIKTKLALLEASSLNCNGT